MKTSQNTIKTASKEATLFFYGAEIYEIAYRYALAKRKSGFFTEDPTSFAEDTRDIAVKNMEQYLKEISQED